MYGLGPPRPTTIEFELRETPGAFSRVLGNGGVAALVLADFDWAGQRSEADRHD